MESPSINHIFGTDLLGIDILHQCLFALFVQFITLTLILIFIFIGGILIGMFLNITRKRIIGSFFQEFLRFWISLPVLLIATFMLVLISSGQMNVIFLLSFFLIPSQALYIMNQLNEVVKLDFVTAKQSQGFSKSYIYRNHLFPFIKNNYLWFTISRIPEIIMLDLTLNYFGLGVQSPYYSFGRMLYDGLGFMFSAWWLWVFPSFVLITFNILLKRILIYGN